MRKFISILSFFVVLVVTVGGFNCAFAELKKMPRKSIASAGPSLPKESVPTDIPANIREQILRLYSKDAVERANAAMALGKMGNKALPAVPYLKGMFNDRANLMWSTDGGSSYSTDPGEIAVYAYGMIKGADELITMLKSKMINLRGAAAAALGWMKYAGAVVPLSAVLKDQDTSVGWRAANALGEIKDTRAVNPLIAALRHPNRDIKFAAIGALRKIKDSRAVEPLIIALKDEDVREEAYTALKDITGQNIPNKPAQWQKWWKGQKKK